MKAFVFREYVPIFLDSPSRLGDNVLDSYADSRLVLWGNGRGTFALNLTDWWGHYSVSAAVKDNSNTVSNQHVVSTSHLTNKLNGHPQIGQAVQA